MSPDDMRGTVLAVLRHVDARTWKELPELFAAGVAVDSRRCRWRRVETMASELAAAGAPRWRASSPSTCSAPSTCASRVMAPTPGATCAPFTTARVLQADNVGSARALRLRPRARRLSVAHHEVEARDLPPTRPPCADVGEVTQGFQCYARPRSIEALGLTSSGVRAYGRSLDHPIHHRHI